MIFLRLFFSFFYVGLFSFGGGLAALPLIQRQIVELNGWLTLTEFTDLVTIAQMTPGPIAINAATFVGTRIAGAAGAVVATVGCVAPSCIIVLALAKLYQKYKELPVMQGVLGGLRPGVVALIANAGIGILLVAFLGESGVFAGLAQVDWIAVALFCGALVLLRRKKGGPVSLMLACGAIGGALYLL